MRLTPLGKTVIIALVVGAGGYIFRSQGLMQKLAPEAPRQAASVPPMAKLPELPGESTAAVAKGEAGCGQLPEVRLFHWAWNAQMGVMLANGGKQAAPGSAMCQHGVNLKLVREDNTDNMGAALMAFAQALKKGEAHPTGGTHLVSIMGDGSATFLKGINDKLVKLGPEYTAVVMGSTGYSRGEDKFMGPVAWKENPQAARGGLVAGVLRDGDWNIAMKWLGDNKIPNNPDEKTYDPDALNWVNASDYIDAAEKYVAGYCTELTDIKTRQKGKHCVNGVVTWTPGDVTVAQKRGGLVNIVSTQEYRAQMPSVLIGIKKWLVANRKIVDGLLTATLEAGDRIKNSDDELHKAAVVSSVVYGEKDPDYWAKYFRIQTEKDKTGVYVELGGSSVSNLADNLQLFGLVPGSTNIFAATYTVFGDIVHQQYPALLEDYDPVEKILDVSFVQDVAAAQKGKPQAAADLAHFDAAVPVKEVVSRKAWDITFNSGNAQFTPKAAAELKLLFRDLVVAGGAPVEIHGHTDNQGSAEKNQDLSEQRAFAVKEWLEKLSPANFPEGRVRVFAHGMTQPVAPNSAPEGRAKNRRVEIVLGKAR